LPLSSLIINTDRNKLTDIIIPSGIDIIVIIIRINRDLAVWGKDTAEWNPEQWLSPLPLGVLDAYIPSIYAGM